MKYLDKDGLQQYDALIKEFVNNHVPDLAQVANLAVALEDAADPTSTVKIALCTQAEYDALESYQENVIYIITDDTSGAVYTYANPVLDGTETVLTGIIIQGIKYAIPQGTEVTANPTLDGNETPLTGLQIGNTKYAVGGSGNAELYAHYIYIKGDDTTPDDDITCSILTNSATPMTFYDICKWLYEHGFNSSYTYFPANSVSAAWTEYGYISIGIKCISNPDTAQNYQIDTTALMIDLRSSSTDRFKRSTVTAISSLQYKTVYDTVIKIL